MNEQNGYNMLFLLRSIGFVLFQPNATSKQTFRRFRMQTDFICYPKSQYKKVICLYWIVKGKILKCSCEIVGINTENAGCVVKYGRYNSRIRVIKF
jgi:hypothetical protein